MAHTLKRSVTTCFLAALVLVCAGTGIALACPPGDDHTATRLDVENILQNPSLPNGCEITSLTIVLQWLGFDVSKEEMADGYLPKATRGDPYQVYIGNPRGAGWYCWAPPIVEAAGAYLETAGSELRGQDITGADEHLFYDYIDCGVPVVTWVTIDWRSPRVGDKGMYTNVHCLVMTGYDTRLGVVYVANPLGGTDAVDSTLFFETYQALGGHAMVVAALSTTE